MTAAPRRAATGEFIYTPATFAPRHTIPSSSRRAVGRDPHIGFMHPAALDSGHKHAGMTDGAVARMTDGARTEPAGRLS
ncbi:hypothetical protein GCM10027167_65000 [Nocardia heshunensis]